MRKERAAKYVVLLLLAMQLFSIQQAFPHYIDYFNEIVGGPEKGYLYISDSNLNWDQNDLYVAEFIRSQTELVATKKYEEIENKGLWIVDVEKLFGNPNRMSVELKQLHKDYVENKQEPVYKIGNTHWVFIIQK